MDTPIDLGRYGKNTAAYFERKEAQEAKARFEKECEAQRQYAIATAERTAKELSGKTDDEWQALDTEEVTARILDVMQDTTGTTNLAAMKRMGGFTGEFPLPVTLTDLLPKAAR